MKKNIMKIALVAAVAAMAGYGVYANQTKEMMSDVMLENVEALAYINPEIEIFSDFHLVTTINGCKICKRGDGTCNVHDQVPC